MTAIDWNSLNAREKSDLITKHLRDWESKWEGERYYVWFKEFHPEPEWRQCAPSFPSENLEEAIYLIEEMIKDTGTWGLEMNKDKTYTIFVLVDGERVAAVTDESIPEGICKLSLLYKGVNVNIG